MVFVVFRVSIQGLTTFNILKKIIYSRRVNSRTVKEKTIGNIFVVCRTRILV